MNKYFLICLLLASSVQASGEMTATIQSAENAICKENAKSEQCINAVQKLMIAVSKVTELNENCKKQGGSLGIPQQCQQSSDAIGYINSLADKK